MKTILLTFTDNNETLTCVKRNESTALYKRESLEGTLIGYEIFGILRNKEGNEVYPNKKAFGKWAWRILSLKRAEKSFDNITNGDTVIGNYNPETSVIIPLDVDPSLEELLNEPDVTTIPISLETPSDVVPCFEPIVVDILPEIVENISGDEAETGVPVGDLPMDEDPTILPVEGGTPLSEVDIQPTTDGEVLVTVVNVKKTKVETVFNIPTGEFTQAQFAVANGLPLRGVVWSKLDGLVQAGKLSKKLVKVGRGRPTQFFVGV